MDQLILSIINDIVIFGDTSVNESSTFLPQPNDGGMSNEVPQERQMSNEVPQDGGISNEYDDRFLELEPMYPDDDGKCLKFISIWTRIFLVWCLISYHFFPDSFLLSYHDIWNEDYYLDEDNEETEPVAGPSGTNQTVSLTEGDQGAGSSRPYNDRIRKAPKMSVRDIRPGFEGYKADDLVDLTGGNERQKGVEKKNRRKKDSRRGSSLISEDEDEEDKENSQKIVKKKKKSPRQEKPEAVLALCAEQNIDLKRSFQERSLELQSENLELTKRVVGLVEDAVDSVSKNPQSSGMCTIS